MSAESDEDEFNNLQSNTPNVPRKIASSATKSSGGNLNQSRTEAGPSRANNNAASSMRKKDIAATRDKQSDDDEMEIIVEKPAARGRRMVADKDMPEEEAIARSGEDSSAEVEEIIAPPANKLRPGTKKSALRPGKPLSNAANGATKTGMNALVKGKGKQKATLAPRKEPMEADVVEIPVDDMDVDDEGQDIMDEPAIAVAPNRQLNTKSSKSGKGQPLLPQDYKKDAYIARLEKQLQQAENNIKELTRQVEELCQVRKTESEQLMERMESQHQALIEAKDSLLDDLNAQLAKRDPVLSSGKKSAFELLTRDEANNEMHALQEQLKKYREALQERDQRLKDQENEIAGLEEDKRIMSLELKEEVKRNQALNARPPPSTSRLRSTGGPLGPSQDPKYATVINFYEDLTNVIVPSMRMQPGKYLDMEEWILNCCYTHKDVMKKDSVSKSINFTLRLGYEPRADAPKPVTRREDLVPSVHYMPLELHNESQEFRDSLEFLADKFTFERDQLSLFVRTLYDYVGGDKNEGSDEESDNSVQIVE